MIKSDYLVIGSGMAGLSFALEAAKHGAVSVVTKRSITDSATDWAQGGVAAVWSKDDSFEKHVDDTCNAGAGLCKKDVVELVVKEGPERIKELIKLGVNFTVLEEDTGKNYELGLEGGHSRRRILHAKDATGKEIETVLAAKARSNPNIKIYEDHAAIDLITTGKLKKQFQGENETCLGAYVLDVKSGDITEFLAKVVVLATGGAGKVYLYTSNPDVSTGDGIAMAYRCGASIANLEFVQFHPTCLYNPKAKSFLISEALRGEGGILRLSSGEAFMENYHPMRELAPRDIVARAIDHEMKKRGEDCVYLDMTFKSGTYLKKRFPNIFKKCLEFGIDMSKDPIPVVPAAHYFCGGVLTNIHGQSSIRNLFAVGEVSCTGLHGANRLASNSLLEGLVFAKRAAEKSMEFLKNDSTFPAVPKWDKGKATDSSELVLMSQNWDEIRRFMWNYVGIVRTNMRLERAKRRVEMLQSEIAEYYWDFVVTRDLIELRNIATVSELIILAAQRRHESRGLHYTLDFPQILPNAQDTIFHKF